MAKKKGQGRKFHEGARAQARVSNHQRIWHIKASQELLSHRNGAQRVQRDTALCECAAQERDGNVSNDLVFEANWVRIFI